MAIIDLEWGIYSVGGTPTSVTTGAASATVNIPNASDGNKARYVRVFATGNAWIMPVQTGGSVAAGTGILIGNSTDIVLNVRGFAQIAHIQQGSAQTVNIVPLDV